MDKRCFPYYIRKVSMYFSTSFIKNGGDECLILGFECKIHPPFLYLFYIKVVVFELNISFKPPYFEMRESLIWNVQYIKIGICEIKRWFWSVLNDVSVINLRMGVELWWVSFILHGDCQKVYVDLATLKLTKRGNGSAPCEFLHKLVFFNVKQPPF